MQYTFSFFFRSIAVCLLAVSALTLAGCGKTTIGPGPARPDVREMSTPRLAEEADRAWRSKDWAKSELFYERLLQRSDMPGTMEPQAHERFTVSALNAHHFHRAIQGTEAWAKVVPAVRLAWSPWYTTRLAAHHALKDVSGARLFLAETMENTALPQMLREMAVDALFAKENQDEDNGWELARFLAVLHTKLPNASIKARLEAATMDWMASLPDSALQEIVQAGGADKTNTFPYSLGHFESAWRTADDNAEAWPASYRQMRQAIVQGGLYQPDPLTKRLTPLEERYGLPKTGIVLALPLSGRFSAIGWKILKGAGMAQWRLLQQGLEIEVRALNTDSPYWTRELAALPTSFGVIGGPVRKEAFEAADKAGLVATRPFFTFMPSLSGKTEGTDAWRFFGSPQDQVRSLVRLAMERLGIKNFAVLYPQETFGNRMSEIFWKEAEAMGGRVTGIASYPPKDPTQWGASVGKLLQVPPKSATREPSLEALAAMDETMDYSGRKRPDFQAVFLPDGWAQASILAPQFFFFEEDRLLLLGPELWSQALTNKANDGPTDVEDTYFRLAACPGAWWPQSPSPGLAALRTSMDEAGLGEPDFWIALGFDFVRFASRIGRISKNKDAGILNAKLPEASRLEWSLAPMTWDDNGRASQWYYLFQPHSDGLRVIDPEQLRNRMERMRQLHEQREKVRRQNRIDELKGIGKGDRTTSALDLQNISQIDRDAPLQTGAVQ